QLIRRFSDRAQFVIVTHQKRTMGAADVLYGVTMGGDGVTKVVSRKPPHDRTPCACTPCGTRSAERRRRQSRPARPPASAPQAGDLTPSERLVTRAHPQSRTARSDPARV